MTSTLDRTPKASASTAPFDQSAVDERVFDGNDVDRPRTVSGWRARLNDLAWLLPALIVGLIVNAINLGGSPQRIDDEGTYTAQAWALGNLGELTHYTYWYDHPRSGGCRSPGMRD